jgi:hypothetical protein
LVCFVQPLDLGVYVRHTVTKAVGVFVPAFSCRWSAIRSALQTGYRCACSHMERRSICGKSLSGKLRQLTRAITLCGDGGNWITMSKRQGGESRGGIGAVSETSL